MRFARFAYGVAAVYGFLALTPLYFLVGKIGHEAPPPVTHPEFYYGFVGVTNFSPTQEYSGEIVASDPRATNLDSSAAARYVHLPKLTLPPRESVLLPLRLSLCSTARFG